MGRVLCPYCNEQAALFQSSERFYSSGIDYGPMWACDPCDARVGCHKGTLTPLGNLADSETRKARIAAHAAFDPFWRSAEHRGAARRQAYARLGQAMMLPKRDCHISKMDAGQAKQVVRICNGWSL